MEKEFLYKELTYKIIGCCMEVHKELGKGFNEIVYGDALEIEFNNKQIDYSREKKFNIEYKGVRLKRFYKADFVIEDTIILEIKAISKLKIGLLVNFGQDSLSYKRIIL